MSRLEDFLSAGGISVEGDAAPFQDIQKHLKAATQSYSWGAGSAGTTIILGKPRTP